MPANEIGRADDELAVGLRVVDPPKQELGHCLRQPPA